jgi:hypothetical protein
MTRARGLHALARSRDAIADARSAVRVAERTADPALLLLALDAVLALDGTDRDAGHANALTDRIHAALPDELLQRTFLESEVVRRIRGHH